MAAKRQTWHFGVLPFTGTGHVNPLIALSQELSARGHRVTIFEKPKVADRVRQAGLHFTSLDCGNSAPHTARPPRSGTGIWSNISTLRFNLRRVASDVEMFLRSAPPILAHSGVDVLIVNEIALTGPTVAEVLHLPYFIVSTSVPHNFGWASSPWLSRRDHSGSWFDQIERALLELSVFRIRGPIRGVLRRYRKHAGLSSISEMQQIYPCLAHITQIPKCLDLPRTTFPTTFHYTGPFITKGARPQVEFPWERLDGRPVIYASLGTTRHAQSAIFRLIGEACQDFDVQLIISLGGRFDPKAFHNLPGDPVIVRYAPQLDLLKIAAVVITHAGPNTALEALMEGVPMIAIPLAHDQPAIAARLARLTLAEVLPLHTLSAQKVRDAITTIFRNPRYRLCAQRIGAEIRSLHGAEHAADIIEASLANHHNASSRRLASAGLLHHSEHLK